MLKKFAYVVLGEWIRDMTHFSLKIPTRLNCYHFDNSDIQYLMIDKWWGGGGRGGYVN